MSKKLKRNKKNENQQIDTEEEISKEYKNEINNESIQINDEKITLNEKNYAKRDNKPSLDGTDEVITKDSRNFYSNTYVNLYFFGLSVETIYALIYMFCSGLLKFTHLLVFFRYNFKFNFSYMFCHQLVLLIFFCFSKNTKSFKKIIGPISLSDFISLKWFYLAFSIIYALHYLTLYFGMQLLESFFTYLTLRKITYLMINLYYLLVGIKKFAYNEIISFGLIAAGGYFCITDDFSKFYLGIFIVMISNYISSAYYIYSLAFIKRTGVSNLKIFFYNSCLLVPGLFIMIFISGEFDDLLKYFGEGRYFSMIYINSLSGFFITVGFSCCLNVLTMAKYLFNYGKYIPTNIVIIINLNDCLTVSFAYFYIIEFNGSFIVIIGFIITTIGNIIRELNENKKDKYLNIQKIQEGQQ